MVLQHVTPRLTLPIPTIVRPFCRPQNDASFRRQNSTDNVKLKDEIAMEQPVPTAMTLSLCGVGALVAHRWATSPAAQRKFVLALWDALTRKKADVRAAVAMANAGPAPARPLKRWVRLARVVYGLPHVTYGEA
jgi:hypothetical protein